MAKIVRLTENDIQRLVKKIIKENMSLGDFPHITADENDIEALQNDESQVGYGEMSLMKWKI